MKWWLAVLLVAGCNKKLPSRLTEFSLQFVDDARGGTIAAEAIDEELINRVHRAQKLRLAGQGNAPAEILTKIWHDQSETHGTPQERSARQRERARLALRRALDGNCKADVDDGAAALRVGALTEPAAAASEEVRTGLAGLKHDLAKAVVARVSCTSGAIGILAIPRDGSWRVVDLFQLGGGPKLDVKPPS